MSYWVNLIDLPSFGHIPPLETDAICKLSLRDPPQPADTHFTFVDLVCGSRAANFFNIEPI